MTSRDFGNRVLPMEQTLAKVLIGRVEITSVS